MILDKCTPLLCYRIHSPLQENRQNWPRRKFCRDNGALWPRRTPVSIDRIIGKGREWAQEGGETISDTMMVSKGITLLAQMKIFNKNIREWRRQATDQKTWEKFKIFFHRYHRKQSKVVTTARKGVYTAAVQDIYGVPTPPTEEHHEAINHINKIFQWMHMQIHKLEGLSQANTALTSLNTAVMSQFS